MPASGLITSTTSFRYGYYLCIVERSKLNRKLCAAENLCNRGSGSQEGVIMRKLLLVVILASCTQREQPTQRPPAPVQAAQTSASGLQEHTIEVAGEFTPASVSLKAGQSARLHFRRGDKPTCADEIVFPELGIRKKIAVNQTVAVDIPAQQARTLSFVCGMNMMKGSVVVQ